MCDGNLHALNQHLAAQEAADSLDEAVEQVQYEEAQKALEDILEDGVYEDESALDFLYESEDFDAYITKLVKTDEVLQEILIEALKPSYDEAEKILNDNIEPYFPDY